MILEKLRANTKETHQLLEQSMFPFIESVKDIDSYTLLLHLFYGYYKPLQDQIEQHIDLTILPSYEASRKVEWIVEDLKTLGQNINDIPVYALPFVIDSHAAAMGALYVTEGSTLGGKVICKTIATNLGKDDMEGLTFFNGYGGQTGSHWKAFLSVLESYSDTKDEASIVGTANQVFAGFTAWLKAFEPQKLLVK